LTTETSNSHKPSLTIHTVKPSCSNRRIGVLGLIYLAFSTWPFSQISIFRLLYLRPLRRPQASRARSIVSPIQISNANPNWQSSCCAIYPYGANPLIRCLLPINHFVKDQLSRTRKLVSCGAQ